MSENILSFFSRVFHKGFLRKALSCEILKCKKYIFSQDREHLDVFNIKNFSTNNLVQTSEHCKGKNQIERLECSFGCYHWANNLSSQLVSVILVEGEKRYLSISLLTAMYTQKTRRNILFEYFALSWRRNISVQYLTWGPRQAWREHHQGSSLSLAGTGSRLLSWSERQPVSCIWYLAAVRSHCRRSHQDCQYWTSAVDCSIGGDPPEHSIDRATSWVRLLKLKLTVFLGWI